MHKKADKLPCFESSPKTTENNKNVNKSPLFEGYRNHTEKALDKGAFLLY